MKELQKRQGEKLMSRNRTIEGHYAWDWIGESEDKRKLTLQEKETVCKKIGSSIYKPSFAATIAVKIMPFVACLGLMVGLKGTAETEDTLLFACSVISSIVSLFYMIFALFFYLIKEIWVYDRWKAQEKEIMKKDVYCVPVEFGETFQAGGRHLYYCANLKYTEDENYLDTYQITEYLYMHGRERKLYCCYYESKPEKYLAGKYKIFFIGEHEGEIAKKEEINN